MKTKKYYLLFDGRYRTDEDSAVCFEVCETLKEAKESCEDYGTGTVIVEMTEKENELTNPKIIN